MQMLMIFDAIRAAFKEARETKGMPTVSYSIA